MTSMLQTIREAALQEGFTMCRAAPAVTSSGFHRLVDWIQSGYAAEMAYFEKRLEAYRHPAAILEGVRSVVVLTYPYPCWQHDRLETGHGRIARYAWPGTDYHDVIHQKLKRICRLVSKAYDRPEHPVHLRGVVDTAPLMEREVAQLAGVGWQGKNTLLLNRLQGSYFFLACLLVDAELPYDDAFDSFHCGTCTRCLDICPTDAFPQPGVLDASRCISYLTIEHQGAIDPQLRPLIGDWIFGCDLCQEVCPWNRRPARDATAEDVPLQSLDLRELFQLDDEAFRIRFKKTPLWRPRRRGLLRNAAIVLGNQRDAGSVDLLIAALGEEDPVVRGAVVWALGRIGGEVARRSLERLRHGEQDSDVRQELERAINSLAT